jgi:hypothetical protein
MGIRYIVVFLMALVGCDEMVLPLDTVEKDAEEECDGEINDAGECVEEDSLEDERIYQDDDENDDGDDEDNDEDAEDDDDDRKDDDDDDRDDDYDDDDDDDRDREGRCEWREETLERCIEELGIDDPECEELQRRYDEEC